MNRPDMGPCPMSEHWIKEVIITMKRVKILIAAMLVLCGVLALCACGGSAGSSTPDSGAATPEQDGYMVSVVDGSGNPYTSGVIVRILKDGEQVAMQVIGEDGTVRPELEDGEYTVELKFTDSESVYYYDTNNVTLTKENPSLEIVLAKSLDSEAQMVHAYSLKQQAAAECSAYPIGTGSTFVALESGERNYFLFTPTEAGTYQFSVNDADVVLGYYGSPYFVQELSTVEPAEDGSFTVSIKAGMIGTSNTGTTVMVIGIDAQEASQCTFNIERVGDPEWSVEDEPWHTYMPTVELAAYTMPAGAAVQEFDLTASTDTYNLVFNDADGFYHLDSADGPLVLVRLGKDGKYLDCFKTILEYSGVNKYFYDENGEFIKKEDYSQCLLEYFNYMDEDNGVYPLTEDLKYIIQMRGDHSGWFDPEKPLYIFKNENGENISGINSEISWLFMCCYIN